MANLFPKLVCHRGAHLWAPENTFASFDLALTMGGDVLEFDVRQSKDGILYILHDAELNRTTNGQGPISDLTSYQIDQLDAGSWFEDKYSGQSVPRLEEFFNRYKGQPIEFYIEVKQADCEALCTLVRKMDLIQRSYTCSFDATMRENMHHFAPDMRKMVHWRTAGTAKSAIENHAASIVEFHEGDLKKEYVQEAKSSGLITQLYHDKLDRTFYEHAIEIGIDRFNMDHLDLFQNLRSQQQSPHTDNKKGAL